MSEFDIGKIKTISDAEDTSHDDRLLTTGELIESPCQSSASQPLDDCGYNTQATSADSRFVDSPYSNTSQPSAGLTSGAVEDEDPDIIFFMSLEEIPSRISETQRSLSSPVGRFGRTPPPTAVRPTVSSQRFFPTSVGNPRAVSPSPNKAAASTQTFTAFGHPLSRTVMSNIRPSSAPVQPKIIDEIVEELSEEESDVFDSNSDDENDEDLIHLDKSHRLSQLTLPTQPELCSTSAPNPNPLSHHMPDVVQEHLQPSTSSGAHNSRCHSVPAILSLEQHREISSIGHQLRVVGDTFHMRHSAADSEPISTRSRRFSIPTFSSLTSVALSPAVSLMDLLSRAYSLSGDSQPPALPPSERTQARRHTQPSGSTPAIPPAHRLHPTQTYTDEGAGPSGLINKPHRK